LTTQSAFAVQGSGRPSRALLSLDVTHDGLTVAAGTELAKDDALIHFWDPRHPAAPLRTHSATHSDDITALRFAPVGLHKKLLLSASTDGLVSMSNPDENDEDEAGLAVGNWGCSVSQVGWFTPANGKPTIWAASDMETFSLWTEEVNFAAIAKWSDLGINLAAA
jgi:WD repeat-containing protein 89